MFEERFDGDPAAAGWRTFGNTNQFQWNSAASALDVTWDSSQPNSYFYRPLGTVLARTDDVELSFDLRLHEVEIGITPGQPFTFELVVGLLNLRQATSPGFVRGTAGQSPNLLEFDYFPDSGFGATISPVIVSSNSAFVPSFSFPLELTLEDQFHIQMQYTAATRTLATSMLRNGAPFGPIKPVVLGSTFTDFRLDAVAIASYSDQGADGSLRARGSIDNLVITTPEPPHPEMGALTRDAVWKATVSTQVGWVYVLERTENWREWQAVSGSASGNGGVVELRDESADLPARACYRVRAERP